MQTLPIISGIITALYGILNTFAGVTQLKVKKIQTWAAWLMVASGLLLLAAGYLVMARSLFSLTALVIGLIAVHVVTIINGLYMHGRIQPGHHLFRLVISLVLLGLGSWSQS
jgi:uncharacterized membrane-anchored protein